MKRALLSQMAREWKNNIWLILELAIVALAIWAIMTLLWIRCKGLTQPLGFDPRDVYTLEVKSVPESSPYFLPEYKEKYYQDRNELIQRLRRNPNIEGVSLHNNFAPFEYNYSGNYFHIKSWPDSIGYSGNVRKAEPDIIRIMDIKSTTGKSSEQLTDMLERGEVLISHNEGLEEKMGPMENIIGEKMQFFYQDEEIVWRIGDVVERVKRSDYEYDPRGVIIMPIQPDNEWGDIILRIKPGKDSEFINDFNTDPSLSRLRNVYLSNLKSLVDKGNSLNEEIKINIRLMIAISFFLIVTIFLGLLGSFWFRIQQRVSEIAIRKTYGATNRSLFRRIISEGMLLLLSALILISACIWPFVDRIADFLGEQWWIFLIFESIVAGLMSVGIILSLWYPAYRAMKIEPAIAVKEQ